MITHPRPQTLTGMMHFNRKSSWVVVVVLLTIHLSMPFILGEKIIGPDGA